MPIISDILNTSFTVSGVNLTYSTDLLLNVFRRKENIVYKPTLFSNTIGIAYYSSEEINALSNIFIADRSNSLIENRVDTNSDLLELTEEKTVVLDSDTFFATDMYVSSLNSTGVPVPLFKKHIISTTNLPRTSSSDLSLGSGVQLSNVKILNESFEEVSNRHTYLNESEGILYSNIINSYSRETGLYTVYYLQYTVTQGSVSLTYIDLLNSVNTYSLATYDDIDSDTLNLIDDGRKVYLLEEIGDQFQVTFPAKGTYTIKIPKTSKIKINTPNPTKSDSPWVLSVSNGDFFANVNGSPYRYHVTEFNNQSWDPYVPIKKTEDEESIVISSSLIKLLNSNIYQSSNDSLYLDILVDDKYDKGVAAFTTNLSKDGTTATNGKTFAYWDREDKVGIKSLDLENGILDIEGLPLLSSYKVYSTYYYEEKDYAFTSIDFNPLFNRDILKERVSLFINPDSSFSTQTQSLYYLVSDKSGQVIDSDWSQFNTTTRTINGKPLFYETEPSWSPYSGDVEIFTKKYSTEHSGVFLILGDVFVAENTYPSLSNAIDVRTEGGGLKASEVEEEMLKNAEAMSFWDVGFWDGTPFPGSASYFVEVPTSVLDGAGGSLLQSEIKDIVDRHTALGVYPVVKAYGVDPVVSGVYPATSTVSLKFSGNGSDANTYFNIYHSRSPTGPWTLYNSEPLPNNSNGLSYTVSGLNSRTLYYLKVIGGIKEADGTFVPQEGQPIGPFEVGALGINSSDGIVTTRTFSLKTTTDDILNLDMTVI